MMKYGAGVGPFGDLRILKASDPNCSNTQTWQKSHRCHSCSHLTRSNTPIFNLGGTVWCVIRQKVPRVHKQRNGV